jgi:hypothetical protein
MRCHYLFTPTKREIKMNTKTKTPLSLIKSKLKTSVSDTPEARLMLAIILQAVADLTHVSMDNKGVKTTPELTSAIDYLFLRSEIPHAELCGLDSEYVRDVIYKVFLFMSKNKGDNSVIWINSALSRMPTR